MGRRRRRQVQRPRKPYILPREDDVATLALSHLRIPFRYTECVARACYSGGSMGGALGG